MIHPEGWLKSSWLPFKFTSAFGEKIILPVEMYHAILENALPLVLHTLNFVICAKHDIFCSTDGIVSPSSKVIVIVRVVQIRSDSSIVIFSVGSLNLDRR